MTENKQVQIIARSTQEEKAIITKAKGKGISVNEFIKRILNDIKKDINDNISDNKK